MKQKVAPRAARSNPSVSAPPRVRDVSARSGEPLEGDRRATDGASLAHDFNAVRVHPDDGVVRRDGGESNASIELCFVPIRAFHLSEVGGVHVVLNVRTADGNARHIEVDPAQHQGIEDPASVTVGPGRVAGLHSHVVVGPGTRSSGSCQTFPATPDQVASLMAAATRYEEMDVAYEPPGLGPNSNSFGEWALTEAGITTSTISVPTGAHGWSWYQGDPSRRTNPPRVARTYEGTQATCRTPRARATTLRGFIDLIRDAEAQLATCGVTDVGEVVHILRGIFYGTPWSRDFGTSERSHARTQMFNVYAGSTQPRNPIECLDCGTFLAIGASQDMHDQGRHVDVGHMFMGMDARRSAFARTVPQPVGQVTGLEASTWAGDLGGGAARLSMSRTRIATTPATRYFSGSNYGGSINLEGDVASYAVGAGSLTQGAAPALEIPAGSSVADALQAYFFGDPAATPAAPSGWDTRCRTFLTSVGGTVDASGALANRGSVATTLAEQIYRFGCWYLVNYQRQHGGMDASALEAASRHMLGASTEIAELFLNALERCSTHPGSPLAVAGPAPTATPAGDPGCLIARAVPEAGRALDRARQTADETLQEAERYIERQQRALQQRWRQWWQ